MALSEGTSLGVYKITGPIGAGGMGEVYRATDSKLGRDVAIKTLPVALADDLDRLARFEREAKLLAALNHPHIASVYSLDEHDGTLYIAMELVEGETLGEKLKHGALAVDEALRLGLQIAEALEAAHDKGVVHRDLKPANVMVTQDGIVKVLDFGLAKAFSDDPNQSSPTQSPALSVAMTQQGLVLGTAGYMSPEQASGQPTDQRADIWAFGVVLYEMLTGLPLFSGESVPHILADVLKTEPDWSRLPANLHPRLKLMLERCLTKRPKDRYHAIADARVDIQVALSDPDGVIVGGGAPTAAAAVAMQPLWRRALLPLGSFALGAAVLGMAIWWTMQPAPGLVNKFDFDLPEGQALRSVGRNTTAFSPDGRRIVYNSTGGLYVRELSGLESRLISGTEPGLANPFFSADSQQVAYFDFDRGEIRRVAISGGAPVTIASADNNLNGASWTEDGTILFATDSGIYRVPATAGEPELLVEALPGERLHGPRLLPGGEAILYTVRSEGSWDEADIVVESLMNGERTVVIEGGADARYLPTGHIVYALGEDLLAIAFDLDTLTRTAGPASVIQGVSRAGSTGSANFSVSRDGTLVYFVGGSAASRTLLWVDRDGREETIGIEAGEYTVPRISPDPAGSRIAVDSAGSGGGAAIWIYTFASRTLQRLRVGDVGASIPIWSPDGDRIAYSLDTGEIGWTAANNTGVPEILVAGQPPVPYFFATDPLRLVYGNVGATSAEPDVMMISVERNGEAEAEALLGTDDDERNPVLHPNGFWMAYQSEETGEREVYVRPFPNVDGTQIAISNATGLDPAFSRDGSELFYLEIAEGGMRMMSVAIEEASEDAFEFSVPTPLFDFPYLSGFGQRHYDVAPDASRFLVIGQPSIGGDQRFIIVQNWFEELNELVPTD